MFNRPIFRAISILSLGLASSASAVTLLTADFEGANDMPFAFAFSQSNLVPISNDSNSPNGNGSEGHEFSVTTTTAATFAGAGWGAIDLAVDPQFVAGSITVAQLDLLRVSFDAEIVGSGINTWRFEASLPAGDFGNRVNSAAPAAASGWTNYVIDFSTLDASEKAAMVASLNTNSATALNMAFSFSGNGAGEFVAGDTVRIDNFVATTIPEPGSASLLVISAVGLAMRRTRRTHRARV